MEIASKDADRNASLLGEYGGETKRVKADQYGSLCVTQKSSGGAVVDPATAENQGMYRDDNGNLTNYKSVDGKPRFSDMPYLFDITEGNVANHTRWSKVGFSPSVGTTESDIWGATGNYVFPTSAQQMEVVSSNANDAGVSIFSGNSSGGSLTTLIDITKDFTSGTAVVAGDLLILDKSGTVPEYGYVTGVTATTLTVAGGFSSGGTGNARAYSVIDQSGSTGLQVVRVAYLDGSYAEKIEIVILNGLTVVPTVNTNIFRINSFRGIAAGSVGKAVGNISLRNLADTPIYSYILANFTRARNSIYTVPAGKTLYITSLLPYYATSGSPNKEYARIITRANIDPDSGFSTDGLFNPYTECVAQNASVMVNLEIPTRLLSKTDIKVSTVASATGVAGITMRGWLEDN